MGLFTRQKEYQKLSKAFFASHQMIQKIVFQSKSEDVQEDIYFLTYLCRREIIIRLQTYGWPMNNKIYVRNLSHIKTIASAYEETILKLIEFSEIEGYSDEVLQILEGKPLYYELDEIVPAHLKTLFK